MIKNQSTSVNLFSLVIETMMQMQGISFLHSAAFFSSWIPKNWFPLSKQTYNNNTYLFLHAHARKAAQPTVICGSSRACSEADEQAVQCYGAASGGRWLRFSSYRMVLCHSNTLGGPVAGQWSLRQHYRHTACILGWGVAGMGSVGLGPWW